MKKMFVGLIACALIFTSCSNNEVLENTSPSNAIQFSKLNSRFTKTANDNKSDYKVLAAWSEFNTAWYMNGKVGGIDNEYFPLMYWPEKGLVDFYAYCPGETSCFNVTSTPTSAVKGVYTVGPTAKEDFTIATPVMNADSKTGEIGLVFEHMLSRITLTVAIETNGGLHKYEISASSAKFTLDYNSATFNVMSRKPKDAMVSLGSVGTNSYTMIPDGHSLIGADYLNVLPQPLSEDSKLELTVSIKPIGISENIIEERTLKAIKLKDVSVLSDGFEAGKWYQFTVTISNTATDGEGNLVFDKFNFKSEVSDWNSASSNTPQP